jgi:hypothetical protein
VFLRLISSDTFPVTKPGRIIVIEEKSDFVIEQLLKTIPYQIEL